MSEPTEPGDPLEDRLKSGFGALARAAGDPSPVPASPAQPLPAFGHPARRRLLAAAAVLVLIGVGAVLATRDHGTSEQLRAGEVPTATTSLPTGTPLADRNTPPPDEDALLVCPPALLDLSAIDAEVRLVPPEDDPFGPTPQPYVVRWEQDAYTIELSYPYAAGPTTMAIRTPEPVPLSDGRIADLYRDPEPEVHVHPPDLPIGPLGCGNYWIRVVHDDPDHPDDRLQRTPAHETLLAIAEAVRVSDPPGTVAVPDVTGQTVPRARDALARAGLLTSEPWLGTDDGRTVTGQTPEPGADARYGTEVDLTFSAPTTTTSPPPPPVVEVDALPIPTAPLVCPMGRLQVDGDFRSQPEIHHDTTIAWQEPGDFGGITVMISWPNEAYADGENHGSRELTVQGRPALMHDGGDGQDLVYDTGLPGACRYLEVGVYGGQLAEREPRAEQLAGTKITFAPPPTSAPPAVTGLTVAEAADRLARAGFIPDWGEAREIGDAPAPVPTAVVTGQSVTEPGVVRLTS